MFGSVILRHLAGLCIITLAGCAEFAIPSELDRPQVLAIICDPPTVSAGQRTQLSVVAAGPQGLIPDPPAEWELARSATDPAVGSLDITDAGVFYQAPTTTDQVAAAVSATVQLDDLSRDVLKLIPLGSFDIKNPVVTTVVVDGKTYDGTTPIDAITDITEIAINTEEPISDKSEVSWYATPGVGKIERYKFSPTEIEPAEEPKSGFLIVVVRDQGGVGSKSFPVN